MIGRDPTGAMYGAYELAERLRLGTAALPVAQSFSLAPAVPLRAANLFLVLPAPGEAAWWFLDPDFWTEYLDLMVRARLDFLDLHAMYNLDNTIFPNALLYFAHDQREPARRRRRLPPIAPGTSPCCAPSSCHGARPVGSRSA